MIFSLGNLQFEFNKNAPTQLNFSQKASWQTDDSIGGAPRLVKVPGSKNSSELSFDCLLLMQNSFTLDKLKEMIASDKSYPLIDGEGNVCGDYVISGLSYKLSKFTASGLPRTQEITINLIKDDSPAGTANSQQPTNQPQKEPVADIRSIDYSSLKNSDVYG